MGVARLEAKTLSFRACQTFNLEMSDSSTVVTTGRRCSGLQISSDMKCCVKGIGADSLSLGQDPDRSPAMQIT